MSVGIINKQYGTYLFIQYKLYIYLKSHDLKVSRVFSVFGQRFRIFHYVHFSIDCNFHRCFTLITTLTDNYHNSSLLVLLNLRPVRFY